ncbi:EamA family transporter [Comamonas serinivorans]|uniref:EamA family transporter n=1 Tax=Comamonas serinivorans TaxID=1082851 RepID=A0A1Y0ESI9_9BURK|nr:DMT family transporter [Comamonas serinivorans]ARU06341.1 EamA family transporter [Comamonas serinivorans]
MSSARQALWAAHVAAVLFGMTGVLGALIQASAWVITFGRASFAVVAIAVFAHLVKQPLRRGLTPHALGMLLVTGLLLAAHWVTFFVAVKVGGIAVATLGFASFPAFIALVDATWFREHIGQREAGLIALVSLGLVLVTPSFNWGHQGTAGLLWGLGSGVSFGLLAVINRRSRSALSAVQVALGQNIVVALAVAPMVWLHGLQLSPSDWGYLALLGVICTGLSQYLFVYSLGALNARVVGLIIALEPVYAIAVAWWLFAEQPSFRMLLGAALIVLATVVSALPRRSSA